MGAGSAPAGWYPDVERPGGERYWDGSAWTEQRRDPSSAASANAYQQPGYGHPGYGPPPASAPLGYQPYGTVGGGYPPSSVPGWALGLSIFGLVCCVFTSIAGAIMGWGHMQAVDRGERDPATRGTAKAAFIVGIVAISINAVVLVIYLIAIIGVAASGN